MLKNGNSFQGIIARNTRGYSIETQTGNVLFIADDQVDFIVDSIEEAYWMRLAKLSSTDLASHEALFYWCVKHHLISLAQNQLDVLRALNYSPNRRLALQNQLDTIQFAKHQTPKIRPSNQLPHLTVPADPIVQDEISPPVSLSPLSVSVDIPDLLKSYFDLGSNPQIIPLPPLDNSFDQAEIKLISQVGYEAPIEESQESVQTGWISNSKAEATELTSTELAKWAKGLPPKSLQKFRQSIEPLLIANCGQCHHQSSPEAIEFRLIFAGFRQPRSLLISQRNLHNVWSILKRDGDFESRPISENLLIRYALTAHGDSEEPPINQDSPENKLLVEWIQIAISMLPETTATADGRSDPTSKPTPPKIKTAATTNAIINQSVGNLGRGDSQEIPTLDHLKRQWDDRPPVRGGNLKEIPTLDQGANQFQPRDEFDPEIFNRGLHRPKYTPL